MIQLGGMIMSYSEIIYDITRENFDAALFDLDGVITRTAKVHSSSWKQLFDDYLQKRAIQEGTTWKPFDEQEDYQEFVDGKPRYEGVKSFLLSRNIEIPYGDPSDSSEKETICGLGNRKNLFFHENLNKIGVEVFTTSVELIRLLRSKGFKTAVVSSSKNCASILDTADLTELFDTLVDGVLSAKIGLTGKPEPDIFLEASKRLEVTPERSIVFEDAVSGVQAGRSGNFGLVTGVDRTGHEQELLRNGADIVVKDLSQLSVENETVSSITMISHLPSALDSAKDILKLSGQREFFIALDYDGTLTPIVSRPDLAVLSEEMRETVRNLAKSQSVAVISGRDLEDVRNLVKLDNIIYAGSHGFDISSMDRKKEGFQMGKEILPELDSAEKALHSRVDRITGALIERKRFSIAVHYRQVEDGDISLIEEIVDEVLNKFKSLTKGKGKKVFELKPDIQWDKGKALLWVLDALERDLENSLTIYIGDDITDEDAFRELKGKGIGIIVKDNEPDRTTFAEYALNNTSEVGRFLGLLTDPDH